jgi:ubiquinone/menaquinone biosynthesis C-methylase UbiE
MKRILEPELMNDPEQAATYAGKHMDDAYWLFEQCFRKFIPNLPSASTILDIGCGPAAIALRLAKRFPHCTIHGVDGSKEMLAHGEQTIRQAGLEHQVQLIQSILPDTLPLPRSHYTVIISNSFLHHLHDPMVLWNTIKNYGGPTSNILIIDLIRPENESQAHTIIERYMPNAPSQLCQDMILSLRAAFTLEEVREQLQDAKLLPSLSLTMASPFQFAIHGEMQ